MKCAGDSAKQLSHQLRQEIPPKQLSHQVRQETPPKQLSACHRLDTEWYPCREDREESNFYRTKSQRAADRCAFKSEEFLVTPRFFAEILQFADCDPVVDVFASAENKQLPKYWCKQQDAFLEDWSGIPLYLHPPYSRMTEVVAKIADDGAFGVLVMPIWPTCEWFDRIRDDAVQWFDVPLHRPCLMDRNMEPLPRRGKLNLRVVVFNARHRRVGAFGDSALGYRARWHEAESVPDDRSIIDSTAQSELCHKHVELIKEELADVFTRKLAREVNREPRGAKGHEGTWGRFHQDEGERHAEEEAPVPCSGVRTLGSF